MRFSASGSNPMKSFLQPSPLKVDGIIDPYKTQTILLISMLWTVQSVSALPLLLG
jgi:hypothetical protein